MGVKAKRGYLTNILSKKSDKVEVSSHNANNVSDARTITALLNRTEITDGIKTERRDGRLPSFDLKTGGSVGAASAVEDWISVPYWYCDTFGFRFDANVYTETLIHVCKKTSY